MNTTMSPRFGSIRPSMVASSSGHPWISPIANSRPVGDLSLFDIAVLLLQQLARRSRIFYEPPRGGVRIGLALAHFLDQALHFTICERSRGALFELSSENFCEFALSMLTARCFIGVRTKIVEVLIQHLDQGF